MTIMSGRMGEDAEAIRRRWPFPDPPLNNQEKDTPAEFDEKLKVFDNVKEKIHVDPLEHEQMK